MSDLDVNKLTNIIVECVKSVLKKSYLIPVTLFENSDSEKKDISEVVSPKVYTLLSKKVIVEDDIKKVLKQNIFTIELRSNAIITPAAKDEILHKKIKVIKK